MDSYNHLKRPFQIEQYLSFFDIIFFMSLSVQSINTARHYINNCNERQLDLRNKNVSEISNLNSTMNYFEAIDLSNNDIKAVNNIPYLDRLTTLILIGNKISQISKIGQFLPNLHNMFLINNRIKAWQAIQNLGSCPKLFNLVLNNNPICEAIHYRTYVIVYVPTLKQLDFKKVTQRDKEQAKMTLKL